MRLLTYPVAEKESCRHPWPTIAGSRGEVRKLGANWKTEWEQPQRLYHAEARKPRSNQKAQKGAKRARTIRACVHVLTVELILYFKLKEL